jgi:hypothetical protein
MMQGAIPHMKSLHTTLNLIAKGPAQPQSAQDESTEK